VETMRVMANFKQKHMPAKEILGRDVLFAYHFGVY
jgi:hypothetical protein